MALRLPSHVIQSGAASPVVSLGLSSDGSLFATAETSGWRLWDTTSLKLVSESGTDASSFTLAIPLHRSNIVLLVGGSPSPKYAPNQLIFWDQELSQAVFELEFGDEIRGIATRYDRLIVVLSKRVWVFALGRGTEAIWQEATYETAPNPQGLVAVSHDPETTLLAFPGRQPGHLQLTRLPPHTRKPMMTEIKGKAKAGFPAVAIIIAHASSLSAVCCTSAGTLLATASTKGTLVRLWDAASTQLIRELRRGSDPAEIFSIALRPDGGALAVSSDKGTVHVWELAEQEKPAKPVSPESGKRTTLSALKPYLPKYFSSEWSHSQFRLPPPAVPLTRFSSVPDEAATIQTDVCTCVWLPAAEDPSQVKLHLLTNSGGSFRLALEKAETSRPSSPVPQAWGATGNLRLEEYKRFGGDPDWD